MVRCDRVVNGLWCLWVGGRVEGCCGYLGGRKTAISHERLGARGWSTARRRATAQGYAMAAADGACAATLYRYGDNTAGRPHGHFKSSINALRALRSCTKRVATGRAHRYGSGTKWEGGRHKGEGRAGCGSLSRHELKILGNKGCDLRQAGRLRRFGGVVVKQLPLAAESRVRAPGGHALRVP